AGWTSDPRDALGGRPAIPGERFQLSRSAPVDSSTDVRRHSAPYFFGRSMRSVHLLQTSVLSVVVAVVLALAGHGYRPLLAGVIGRLPIDPPGFDVVGIAVRNVVVGLAAELGSVSSFPSFIHVDLRRGLR